MNDSNQPLPVLPRLKQLDFLRGVAILLVLGNHFDGFEPNQLKVGPRLAELWACGGWIGVDLFFVLSGFLVSGLLFARVKAFGSSDIKRFLIRRGFKIYPVLYVFLFLSYAYQTITFRRGPVHSILFSDLFFLQNYLGTIESHLWSIAVEEHFYLLLAVIVWIHIRRAKLRGQIPDFRFIPKLFLGSVVVCGLLRYWAVRIHPEYDFFLHMAKTHHRIDSLLCGVFLSYLQHYKPQTFQRISSRPALLVSLSALVLTYPFFLPRHQNPWITHIGITIISFACAGILLGTLRFQNMPRLLSPIAKIGFYSYSIYLFHQVANRFSRWVFDPFTSSFEYFFYMAGYLSLSIGVGICAWKLIENPSLKLREKLFPDVAPVVAAPSNAAVPDNAPSGLAISVAQPHFSDLFQISDPGDDETEEAATITGAGIP